MESAPILDLYDVIAFYNIFIRSYAFVVEFKLLLADNALLDRDLIP